MTNKPYIKITIYDKYGNKTKLQGDDIGRELKHAKEIFYRKIAGG